MFIIFLSLTFILGAVVGSFLNVLILRLPQQETIFGRSYCPKCRHVLGFLDLFPLLSFIFVKGKCRYCLSKISARYFFIELTTGLLFALSFMFANPQDLASLLFLLKIWFIICVCLVTFVVDFEHYVILSNVVLPSTVVVLLINLALDVLLFNSLRSSLFLGSAAGAFFGSLPVYFLWFISKFFTGQTGRWMGFGDVLLMIFLGAGVGFPLVFVMLFLAILGGGIISIFLMLLAGKTLKSKLPFGVFLTPATVVAVFYGDSLLKWYLALLGL